jgi:quinol monooxygenase YgiN
VTGDKSGRPLSLQPGAVLLDGHIDVPDDRMAMVAAALPLHIRLTREEPGCLHFQVTVSPDAHGRFLVSETFVDRAAFDAHQARAAASPWAETTRDIERRYHVRTV